MPRPTASATSVDDSSPTDAAFARTLRRGTYSPAVSLFVFTALLLALIAFLLHTMRWVDRTNRVIVQALKTERLLLNLQTASRGYFLTGDPAFLAPYKDAKPDLPAALTDLRAYVEDNAAQSARADRIIHGTNEWLRWVESIVRAPETTTTAPTRASIEAGQARFAPVRDEITVFLTQEYALRDARARRAQIATWFALAALLTAAIITAILQCAGVRRRIAEVTETYRSVLRISKERRARIADLLKELDRELKAVGEIQRSLLPIDLPHIPGLDIAASYQTSRRAGGDYYDFFRLPPETPDDHRARYGILIADVSGHGTPAAVLMAVTHSIAHSFEQPTSPPHELLAFVNRRLRDGYTSSHTAFVTAFYAIYDPAARTLTYSSAGHNPPRLRRAGSTHFEPLDDAQGLPLAIAGDDDEPYVSATRTLAAGDTLVLYTDGITEARNAHDVDLGVAGLDAAVSAAPTDDPDALLASTLTALDHYAGDNIEDDRTLLILRVTPATTPTPNGTPRQAVITDSPTAPLIAIKP